MLSARSVQSRLSLHPAQKEISNSRKISIVLIWNTKKVVVLPNPGLTLLLKVDRQARNLFKCIKMTLKFLFVVHAVKGTAVAGNH